MRLFRPFSVEHFIKAIPASVKSIAVLDRTKEPGAIGEPLYEDVRTAIGEAMGAGQGPFKAWPTVIGGRYGLGSAEFTPTMAKAVLDELKKSAPKNHFAVGIDGRRKQLQPRLRPRLRHRDRGRGRVPLLRPRLRRHRRRQQELDQDHRRRHTQRAQGYFFYDSKKAGTYTISNLRFGPKAIKKPYLVGKANFLACHKFSFLERLDMLANAKQGGVFLLNSPFPADKVWDEIPVEVQQRIIDKKLKFYVIDGMEIAEKTGMGSRVNTIMQTAFFKISGVLPEAEAIKLVKKYTEKTYSRKGADIVAKNIAAIDVALKSVVEVKYSQHGHEQDPHEEPRARRRAQVRQGDHRRDHRQPRRPSSR